MDNPFESPAVLSLCTGMRKLENGFSRAIGRELTTVAYVERDAFVCENLVQQMEQGLVAPAPVWTDVTTFDGAFFWNRIDGILGSYPCQPFSGIGKMQGTDDPRHLYPYISNIIRQSGYPPFIGFENVVQHSRIGFDEVYTDLRDMGYAVEAGIFSALECGLDHTRERLFILAIREDLGYSYIKGLERHSRDVKENNGWKESVGSITTAGLPLALQGEPQFEYEPSRVVSRVGYVINGYDFTTDLLRMAGNAVVEQQAELAFRTLIRKFM